MLAPPPNSSPKVTPTCQWQVFHPHPRSPRTALSNDVRRHRSTDRTRSDTGVPLPESLLVHDGHAVQGLLLHHVPLWREQVQVLAGPKTKNRIGNKKKRKGRKKHVEEKRKTTINKGYKQKRFGQKKEERKEKEVKRIICNGTNFCPVVPRLTHILLRGTSPHLCCSSRVMDDRYPSSISATLAFPSSPSPSPSL